MTVGNPLTNVVMRFTAISCSLFSRIFLS